MIDTLNLRLYLDEATRKTAFAEIPKYFDREPIITSYPNGTKELKGLIDGTLKVSIKSDAVRIKDSSFAKWILGSNLATLTREDIKEAINRLSSMFHLPMADAEVTRVDVGCNILTRYTPDNYFNQLGEMKWFKRLEQPHGLYYTGANVQLAFYDKIKEQRRNGAIIPELYNGLNVLRYELRFLHRLKEVFKVQEVTAKMLYDENFYINLWMLWRANYYNIQKNIDIELEKMGTVKTVSDFYNALILRIIKEDGLNNIHTWIKGMQSRGDINRNQARKLRNRIEQAIKGSGKNADVVKDSELIKELNEKIENTTRYFR